MIFPLCTPHCLEFSSLLVLSFATDPIGAVPSTQDVSIGLVKSPTELNEEPRSPLEYNLVVSEVAPPAGLTCEV